MTGSAEVQYHFGMIHYMMGEAEAAQVPLAQALELDPNFPGHNDARACLDVLAFDVSSANAAARSALEQRMHEHPDPIGLMKLASLKEKDGERGAATALLRQAVDLYAKNPAALARLARLSGQEGKLPEALDLAREARRLDESDPKIAHVLGRLTYQNGDFRWADALLQEASKKLASDPDVTLDAAQAAYAMGRAKRALEALAKASDAEFPRRDEARHLQEMIKLAQKPADAAAAQDTVRAFLRDHPDDAASLTVSAVAAEQQGNLRDARQIYDGILKRLPEFVPAKRRLVILLATEADGADIARAYTLATQVREALPDDPEVARALGILSCRKGNYTRAADLLQESVSHGPDDAISMYYLGVARYQTKNAPESRRALERALSLGLDGTPATDARRILAELP